MNYIGSKLSLLPFLESSIMEVVGQRDFIFSDLFAGTGAVGRYFKERGHRVRANDLQYYSYALCRNSIGNHRELFFTGLVSEIPELLVSQDFESRQDQVCAYLDSLPGEQGFISTHYALVGTAGTEYPRQYFSDENALRCDAIRARIEYWRVGKQITEDEYYFLLASLLESIDRVANTASVYGAFLKSLKKSAQKPLQLKPARYYLNDHEHTVWNADINTLILETTHDVVYLDPPYNHRQYSGNYHILETIARYDTPTIRGKTGLRDCSTQSSRYSKRSEVLTAFRELVENIRANYIFLSYNDEGLMNLDEIRAILSTRGEYGVFEKPYTRFKADKTESRNHKKDSVIEYLHWVRVEKYTNLI